MTNELIQIHNTETGEVIIREMDDDEIAQRKSDAAAQASRELQERAKIAARQAILDRLGLTADEAALLLQ